MEQQPNPPPPPPPKEASTPKRGQGDAPLVDTRRIGERLSMAGKTLQRWTTHTVLSPATPSSSSSLRLLPRVLPPPPPTLPASSTFSRFLEVDDAGLACLAARSPGCLLDSKPFKLPQPPPPLLPLLLRVTEVQFPKHCGLTLETSTAFGNEAIYVLGFSSAQSPALLSGAIRVGDLILGAASGNTRWLPTLDGNGLTELSDFCREHRPVTLRFLTLSSPILLSEIHEDVNKAAIWMQFLIEAPSERDEEDGEEELSREGRVESSEMERQRTSYEGRILAHFAIEARSAINFETESQAEVLDMIAEVVNKHIVAQPQPRSELERQLIAWYHARDLTLEEVASLLRLVVCDVETALEVSYFPRFLHSAQAVEMFRLASITPQTQLLETYWSIHQRQLALDALLQARPTANLLLAFALQRYENIHQKILLWIETEFTWKPLVDEFAWIDSPARRWDSVKQMWYSARLVYDQFLSPSSVSFCGELDGALNRQLEAACLAVCLANTSQVKLAQTPLGDDDFALLDDSKLPAVVATFGRLLGEIQLQVSQFLAKEDKFLGEFCQSAQLFPGAVDYLFAQAQLPRFGSLVTHLPNGLHDHRGAVASPSPIAATTMGEVKLLVRGVVVFNGAEVDSALAGGGERLDLEGLRKFAFPWKGKTETEPDEGGAMRTSSICFPFVVNRGEGSNMFGVTLVNAQQQHAVTMISDLEQVFDLLHAPHLLQLAAGTMTTPTAQALLAQFARFYTPYGLCQRDNDGEDNNEDEVVWGRTEYGCTLAFAKRELELLQPPAFETEAAGGGGSLGMNLLIESLSPRNLIKVFTHLLLEKKVLLVSSRYTVLTLFGQALCALLRPLSWSHVYAPLLPRKMLDLLMCPTPFLLGIHRDYAFKSDFPFVADLCVVDLDWDEVNSSEACHLPRTIQDSLFAGLKLACSPHRMRADGVDPSAPCVVNPLHVRQVFHEAISQLLLGLPEACFAVQHNNEWIQFVNEPFWLANKSAESAVFLSQFARTQHFSGFAVGMAQRTAG